MTRINAGIRPKELTKEHLLAEHREIKRIPNAIYKKKSISFKNVPPEFKLGTGHVTFFYNKLGYLYDRYKEIYNECISRGYNVTNFSESFDKAKEKFAICFGEWEETQEARELLQARINERLAAATK